MNTTNIKGLWLIGLILLASTVFLSACPWWGDDDDNGSSTIVIGISGASVDMTGTWIGECRYDVKNNVSRKNTHIFSRNTMDFSEDTWNGNTGCVGSPDMTEGGLIMISIGSTVYVTWIDTVSASTTPPPGLPSPVQANKAQLSATGFSEKEVWVVDDSGTPLVWYMGWIDPGTPDAEGYPKEVISNQPVTK